MDGKADREEHAADHKPARLFWTTLTLLFVLVLYPLSTGPVQFGYEHLRSAGWEVEAADPILQVVYFPILAGVDSSPAVERVFKMYIRLWVDW